ncbi:MULTISPECIES: bifunctional pyr operon transcriptional regulator/uracil phosphoribosyltransferase PyrR [Prochlorococcus]|uniref:Bifunctional protein PyrR n=1 Tax=Prochlorococcus marinus (strain SARG / CCMP1375 / SS120) TaxID=167539 RepID=Q7VA79_PROMA|nr:MULTISPECIES: bifunctional pyr operon transcriptional regulator/uracil phosphoribosyltransferase PyrR [Prochlorococcus]AAQ00630.1 Uracil phosphoribosyltransferase [Prochlorococcus marinus subsp. marinus str. CCMP1375]KGG10876.1 Xanthine-guanine phosphoribosyltransferase [Prochlorococcus marinus str. LG]KGG20456.1 Xanthine-guanine phosphoribosyltransferase [Prochlorococcus marinus str. SS2]KGG24125.1 Xanthine-guanine phosphoribosyltransferase [Prochlorococcus marinus str. SS35]KGG31618.1 Xan
MTDQNTPERVEILSKEELDRTLTRLASQILENISDSNKLLLLGIPTRGIQLAEVLASELQSKTGHKIEQGTIDPTFYRDDLARVGTRMSPATEISSSLEGRQVVLVDDVIFTGRTVRAALESLQAWGRPQRVMLLVMVDRSGHRELPIQPDFCGRQVPTRRTESIELRLKEIDGEEGVFLE